MLLLLLLLLLLWTSKSTAHLASGLVRQSPAKVKVQGCTA